MKKIYLLFFSTNIFFVLTANSQSITFEKIYGSSAYNEGWDVKQMTDSGFIITGKTSENSGVGANQIFLIRTDKYGDTLWRKTLCGFTAQSIDVTNDEKFVICGATAFCVPTNGMGDMYLIRTNSNGDTLWTKAYGNSSIDYGYSVHQTYEGGYIFCGSTSSYPNVVKTDSAGGIEWSQYIAVGALLSIKQTYDSGYVVAGWLGTASNSYYLAKMDTGGGIEWQKFFFNTFYDELDDVIQTSDSGFIATGGISRYIIKVNAQGDSLWAVTLPGSGWAINNTTDGGFISVGGGPSGMLLIKCDALAGIVWSKIFNLGGTHATSGYSVQQTNDEGFVVSGVAIQGTTEKVYLVKTDSLGNVYTGINENEPEKTEGMVYPNPINDAGYLLLVNQNYTALKNSSFILYDVTGKILREEKIVRFPFKIERKDLKSGMYFYRVADEKGLMVSGKIIMQ